MVLDPTRPKIFLKSLRPYCPRRERPRNPPSRRRKGFQVNKSKMLRLLSSPVLLLVVGCSTHVASLRYKPTEKLVVRAKRIQPVTIGNFADNRGTDPYLLGAIRGGVGIDLKNILADKPVSELVRAAFVEALAARKITEATATSRVAIEGTIVKLDCSYLFNREAHVQLQVNVLSLPARTVIFSKFYGTDNEEGGRGGRHSRRHRSPYTVAAKNAESDPRQGDDRPCVSRGAHETADRLSSTEEIEGPW